MSPTAVDSEKSSNEKVPILGNQKTGCTTDFPKRYILVILGFFGFVNVYAMRVNLSVAMVAMVAAPHRHNPTDPNGTVACEELIIHTGGSNSTAREFDPAFGQFEWDAPTQALILGAFFYGYVVTQIPGGILAEKYGAKWLYAVGVLITSFFTVLTPAAANWGVWPLVIVRAIEGLGEGVTFPAMNALIGRWAPKMERSRMAAIIYNGSSVGNVISFAFSGLICATLGWPSVFYIFGALGFIWSIFWIALVHSTPEDHPCITKEELLIIRRGQEEKQCYDRKIPWKSILTSHYVWALVITHLGQNWGFYTILTELPTYLANILHFDIKRNGLLSALPYGAQALMAIAASFLADRARSSGLFRINTIRKTCNSVAFFGPAICVGLIGFLGCEPVAIVSLLILSMGLNGLTHSGYNVTHVDMCPEFAGTLMGITNCIANFAGFLAPAFVGMIVESGQTIANWRIVFLTTSIVFVVTGIVYDIFCTAELQPWGTNKDTNNINSSKNEDDSTAPILYDSH